METSVRGRLDGSVAIVTGAASGIGRGIAERFAREGARLLVVDTKAAELATLVASAGNAVRTIVADVSADDAPERIATACLDAFGRIDILVNNAGIGGSHEIVETPDEEWQRMLRVNLTSVFRLSRRVLAEMRRQRSGVIVNTASVFGVVGYPGATSYSASKAGIVALTRSMAIDCAPFGVRVNAIAPGLILTDMTRERLRTNRRFQRLMLEGTPLGRVGTPADVAGAVLFLVSDDAAFVTGHVLAVDGGWSAGKYSPPGDD